MRYFRLQFGFLNPDTPRFFDRWWSLEGQDGHTWTSRGFRLGWFYVNLQRSTSSDITY